MENNLQINIAMNYRFDNPGQNIKVDEVISEKTKNVSDINILEQIELFASMSEEVNASKIVKQVLMNAKENARKGVMTR